MENLEEKNQTDSILFMLLIFYGISESQSKQILDRISIVRNTEIMQKKIHKNYPSPPLYCKGNIHK